MRDESFLLFFLLYLLLWRLSLSALISFSVAYTSSQSIGSRRGGSNYAFYLYACLPKSNLLLYWFRFTRVTKTNSLIQQLIMPCGCNDSVSQKVKSLQDFSILENNRITSVHTTKRSNWTMTFTFNHQNGIYFTTVLNYRYTRFVQYGFES